MYCSEHAKEGRREADILYDITRPSSSKRGYDSAWGRARKAFLARHPICVRCEENGRITPATEVDHIVPHRGDRKIFWDSSNWQALCKSCHSRKTASGE